MFLFKLRRKYVLEFSVTISQDVPWCVRMDWSWNPMQMPTSGDIFMLLLRFLPYIVQTIQSFFIGPSTI